MKTVNRKHVALVAGLLSIGAALGTAHSVSADPYDHSNRGHGHHRDRPSYSEGQRIEFPGTVLERARGRGVFQVRGDNNITYSVQPSEAVRLRSGARVRVSGEWHHGVVTNAGVNKL